MNELKCKDPHVKMVLTAATHVALCNYDEKNEKWEEPKFGGTLYICERDEEPYLIIIVKNRLNNEQFSVVILENMVFDEQEPFFLLYTNSKYIHGLLFYKKYEFLCVAQLFQIFSKYLKTGTKLREKDISLVLKEAQEYYIEYMNRIGGKSQEKSHHQFKDQNQYSGKGEICEAPPNLDSENKDNHSNYFTSQINGIYCLSKLDFTPPLWSAKRRQMVQERIRYFDLSSSTVNAQPEFFESEMNCCYTRCPNVDSLKPIQSQKRTPGENQQKISLQGPVSKNQNDSVDIDQNGLSIETSTSQQNFQYKTTSIPENVSFRTASSVDEAVNIPDIDDSSHDGDSELLASPTVENPKVSRIKLSDKKKEQRIRKKNNKNSLIPSEHDKPSSNDSNVMKINSKSGLAQATSSSEGSTRVKIKSENGLAQATSSSEGSIPVKIKSENGLDQAASSSEGLTPVQIKSENGLAQTTFSSESSTSVKIKSENGLASATSSPEDSTSVRTKATNDGKSSLDGLFLIKMEFKNNLTQEKYEITSKHPENGLAYVQLDNLPILSGSNSFAVPNANCMPSGSKANDNPMPFESVLAGGYKIHVPFKDLMRPGNKLSLVLFLSKMPSTVECEATMDETMPPVMNNDVRAIDLVILNNPEVQQKIRDAYEEFVLKK